MPIRKRGDYYHLDLSVGGKRIKRTLKVRTLREARVIASVIELKARTSGLSGVMRTLMSMRSPVTLAEAWADLENHAKAKRRPSTLQRYRSVYPLLEKHFGANYAIGSLGRREVEAYVIWRQAAGRMANTINSELRMLQRLVSLQVEYERLPERIRIDAVPRDAELPAVMTRDEVTRLLEACSGRKSGRLRRMIILAYYTGARMRSEVMPLQRSQVDLDGGTVTFRVTKGKRDRVVDLHKDANQALAEQLAEVRFGDWVFPGRFSGPLNDISEPFRATVVRAGLDPKRISPHSLRHSFATHFLEDGGTLAELMEYGGWRSLAAVQVYMHMARPVRERGIHLLSSVVASQNGPKTEKPRPRARRKVLDLPTKARNNHGGRK